MEKYAKKHQKKQKKRLKSCKKEAFLSKISKNCVIGLVGRTKNSPYGAFDTFYSKQYNLIMSYCNWEHTSPLNQKYHDNEWGVPVHDDTKQFEFLMMEVMQCGLSWDLMINKRDVFRKCFDNFDYDKVAKYTDKDIKRILETGGMIKSIRNINAIIHNAKCFQHIRQEYGSFCDYLWRFSDNKTILYDKHNDGFIPNSNGLSDKISKDLKKYGFKYLGPITIYSHLQACGIINDHDKNCSRFNYINNHTQIVHKKRYLERNVCQFCDK